ncbi:MAG: hypothetical protein EOP06_07485 [Proteobacteria bacterium]|nr:MAG: hypothetical protein EOP06_07485 [Pseudomonadota bacterium]
MKLFALLLFLSSSPAFAQLRCESVFATKPAPVELIQRIWQVTEQEGSEPIVEVDSYPERQPGRKTYRHSTQWSWTHESLKHHVFALNASRSEWTMSNIHSDKFYQTVYGQFQNIIADGTIDALRKVDQTIEVDRSIYGEIRTKDAVIGTWRWFRARLSNSSFPNDESAELPFVRINRARGFNAQLAVTRKLIELMEQGLSVVEIGKLSIDGTTELKKRAIETIELGWLLRASEEDVFVAHVTSKAHARLYKKYGFTVAESFELNGHEESILWVRGYDFRRALEDLHNIKRSNSPEPIVWPIQPVLPNETGPHLEI